MWYLLDEPSAELMDSVLVWASHRKGFIEAQADWDRNALAHFFDRASAEPTDRVELRPTEVPQAVFGITAFLASPNVSNGAIRVTADGSTVLEVDMDERVVAIADRALDAVREAGSAFEDRFVSVDVFGDLDQAMEFVDNVEASTSVDELREVVRTAFTVRGEDPEGIAAQVCIAALVADLEGTVVGTLVAGRIATWRAEIAADEWLQEAARQRLLRTQLPSSSDVLAPAVLDRVVQLQREAARRV